MAHAPVILPAVLRRPACPTTRRCRAAGVLLHGSLALRLYGGDALGSSLACPGRRRAQPRGAAAVRTRRRRCWSSLRAAHGGGRSHERARGFSPAAGPAGGAVAGRHRAVTLVHPFVPAPRWLMIHLLLLGAVTHSILVWSRHFADDPAARPDPPAAAGRPAGCSCSTAASCWWSPGCSPAVWPADPGRGARGGARGRLARRVAVPAAPAGAAGAVRGHGALLRRRRGLLPVGAVFGALMVRGLDGPATSSGVLAHVAVNVLGWMGLTVVGTLRHAVAHDAAHPDRRRRRARRAATALPVLLSAVVDRRRRHPGRGCDRATVLGLLVYLAGLAVLGRPFVGRRPDHTRPGTSPPGRCSPRLGWLMARAGRRSRRAAYAPTPGPRSHERVGWLTPALAAGFGAQVLLGALSYLIPVVAGRRPPPVRAANVELDRGGALRVTLVNAGLLVCLLPLPSLGPGRRLGARAGGAGRLPAAAVPRHAGPPAGPGPAMASHRRYRPPTPHRRGPSVRPPTGPRGQRPDWPPPGSRSWCSESPSGWRWTRWRSPVPAPAGTRPRGSPATGRDHPGPGADARTCGSSPTGSRCRPATGW